MLKSIWRSPSTSIMEAQTDDVSIRVGQNYHSMGYHPWTYWTSQFTCCLHVNCELLCLNLFEEVHNLREVNDLFVILSLTR